MTPYALRAARQRAGLTAAAVARAAGTSTPNVSAYERGTKRPDARTAARLSAAIDCGGASPIHRHRLVTLPAAAAAIRRGLRAGWPTADLLRVARELWADARHLDSERDRRAHWMPPSTTGDRRWDVLLAGVAAMDALARNEPEPAWTRSKVLPHLWFVGSIRSLDGWALAHTPPSLAVRGVVLDEDELGSV